MKTYKSETISLFLGVGLLMMTMVLHPSAGGFEKLSTAPWIVIISHVMAVFSLPFVGIGFFGLTRLLGIRDFFSIVGFGFIILGLISSLIAATLNGIAQPIFAMQYAGATSEMVDILKPIFNYNKAVNMAFDYLIIGPFIFATLCWSLSMLRSNRFSKITAILGVAMASIGTIVALAGFSFITLQGLRIFIFTWVVWVILVGLQMWKQKEIITA